MKENWFKKMKEEAKTQLAILAGNPIENTEQGIHDALEHVFECGTYGDGAKAVMIVGQWVWAHCEETYHSASAADAAANATTPANGK